jgi:hypothetical protein
MQQERRQHNRVQLRTPVRGSVGPSEVFFTEGSVGGVGLEHVRPLPVPGDFCRLDLSSDWGPIRADCLVVHVSEVAPPGASPALYHSGVRILVMDRQSEQRLATLIESMSNDDF